jgi:hypothetical protein
MHAVVSEVRVDPSREEEARKLLHDVVVPQARQFEGFVAGRWLRALQGQKGVAVIFFSSEQAARAAVERARSEGPPPGGPVAMESIDVFEVIAEA